MKIIKPLAISLSNRPVAMPGGKVCLVVTALIGFKQKNDNAILSSEPEIWKALSTVLPPQTAPDLCFDKPFSEWLAFGKVYPQGNSKQSAVASVEISRAGKIISSKKLHISGVRTWQSRGGLAWPSEPDQITEPVLLDWSKSYGGKNHPINPNGIGHFDSSWKNQLIPQIEYFEKLVNSPDQNAEPAGFGPLPLNAANRWKPCGTYDDAWFKNDFPALASDTPAQVLMMASQDQWIKDIFRPNDQVICRGMSSTGEDISWNIPDWVPRCYIKRSGNADKLDSVSMKLDTLIMIPHAGILGLTWRGIIEISESDAFDVELLFAALEHGHETKSLSHYEEQIRKRTFGQKDAGFALLDDGPLLPSGQIGSLISELSPESKARIVRMQDMAKKMKADALEKKDAALKSLNDSALDNNILYLQNKAVDEGQDAATKISDEITSILLSSQPDSARLISLMEQAKDIAKQARLISLKHVQEVLEKNKIDVLALQNKKELTGTGPPARNLQQSLEVIRANYQSGRIDQSQFEEHEKKILNALPQLNTVYRKTAHYMPLSESLMPSDQLGIEIIHYLNAPASEGASLNGVDWVGANLSGQCFDSKNLEGIFLDCSNLMGASFEGANLKNATLSNSNLANANFSRANLENCNFGKSNLEGANFDYAILSNAIFDKALCNSAKFSGAKMNSCSFIGSVVEGSIFDGASLDGSKFMGVKIDEQFNLEKLNVDIDAQADIYSPMSLSGTSFVGASLIQVFFLSCKGRSVSFSNADLTKSNFIKCQLNGINFSNAILSSVSVVLNSEMKESNFSNSTILNGFFRDVDLSGSNFTRAVVKKTNFSLSNMTGIQADGINASQARFERTQLNDSSFKNGVMNSTFFNSASLSNVTFEGADLTLTDFTKAKINKITSFKDVKLSQTKLDTHRN
jgi:uncharacterized protein YjbI with pentapeptide repeats